MKHLWNKPLVLDVKLCNRFNSSNYFYSYTMVCTFAAYKLYYRLSVGSVNLVLGPLSLESLGYSLQPIRVQTMVYHSYIIVYQTMVIITVVKLVCRTYLSLCNWGLVWKYCSHVQTHWGFTQSRTYMRNIGTLHQNVFKSKLWISWLIWPCKWSVPTFVFAL